MDELTEYLMNTSEDGFWDQIQAEVRREAEREPVLASFLFASVLHHRKLEGALRVILAGKPQTQDVSAVLLRDLIDEALAEDTSTRASIRADLLAARTRDPAARGYAQPFLYYKGSHSSRRTAWHTGCGSKASTAWPSTSRTGSRRRSGSMSIPLPGSARAS
jgi:hypothetical protein